MRKYLIVLISFFIMLSLHAQYGTEAKDLGSEDNKVVIVKEGDTLWDLCEEYLGDPFLWPKVWALNPQIENPHLIEPGDKINFNLKTGEIKITPKNQINTTEVNAQNTFDSEEFNTNSDISIAEKKNFMFSKRKENPDPDTIRVKDEVILTAKKFKNSGKIVSSKEEKYLLSKEDIVYIKFKNPDKIKVGDKFNIYKIRKKLVHPLRNLLYNAYIVDILGEVTVTGKTSSKVVAVITNAYQEIERGDYVVPKFDLGLDVKKVKAPVRIDGHIIDFAKQVESIANKEIVFIDKGENQGVKKGMMFRILRDKDPITGEYIPTFQIGKLIIIKTNKNTSTAFVTVATQNLKKGDRITTHFPKKVQNNQSQNNDNQ